MSRTSNVVYSVIPFWVPSEFLAKVGNNRCLIYPFVLVSYSVPGK